MHESTFLNPAAVIEAAKIHEGMRVADFGAGSGFCTRAAARVVGPKGVVWAVDAHRDLLPRLKNISLAEGLRNVEVLYGDVGVVGGSNLPAEHFDVCILTNILFAVEDTGALIYEVHRVLKRGGYVVVVDWADSFGGLGPHPDHVVLKSVAKRLFEERGFTVENDVPAGEYHWGFVARRKSPQAAQLS